MRGEDKIIEFVSGKKNRLIEKGKRELTSLKKFGLYRIAEDIYHTLTIMDFSNAELDRLLSHRNVLEMLAIQVQEDEMYDELIDGVIERFLGR